MAVRVIDEWNKYAYWLMDYVGFTNRRYHKLLEYLHDSPFVYYIGRDKNRAEDGKYLRGYYLAENDLNRDLFKYEECSVLEMLVAFAVRLDSEWIGDPSDQQPQIIFFEMIKNLGLDRLTTRKFNEPEAFEILGRWIKREFDYDGTGSIFPLRNPSEDQRNVEIWCQAMAYISENY